VGARDAQATAEFLGLVIAAPRAGQTQIHPAGVGGLARRPIPQVVTVDSNQQRKEEQQADYRIDRGPTRRRRGRATRRLRTPQAGADIVPLRKRLMIGRRASRTGEDAFADGLRTKTSRAPKLGATSGRVVGADGLRRSAIMAR